MEFKVSENNKYTSIVAGLNSEYKGKVVKINFQSFKDSHKSLNLKERSSKEFKAEITNFTEGENGTIYANLYIIDILLYDYSLRGESEVRPLGYWSVPLEDAGNKYVYNKVNGTVMVDYYYKKLGQLQDTAFSGDKQAVKKLCNELVSEIIKDGEEIVIGRVKIMKGVWRSIAHINNYYFGEQLYDILIKVLNSKTTNDGHKKFTIQEFEEDMQNCLYKWVINEYMLNEDIL